MAWIDQSTALSRSQSANTRLAPFPPISKLTRFSVGEQAFMMARPVFDSPVKVTRSTSGCVVNASPASPGPNPCTTFNTPGGKPASTASSASRVHVPGVCSAGLRTTVLPNASAGATFHVASISGKFQGEIAAATPTGS